LLGRYSAISAEYSAAIAFLGAYYSCKESILLLPEEYYLLSEEYFVIARRVFGCSLKVGEYSVIARKVFRYC
jgi:hypothetical protein